MNISNKYSLIKSIKSYNYSSTYNNYFNQLTSFNYICTSFNGYIVVDYGYNGYNKIIEFDTSFKFIRSYNLNRPHSIITVNNSNTIEIYVSSFNGIYKFNISLSLIGYYYDNYKQYSGLYYNQTGDYVVVCSDYWLTKFNYWLTKEWPLSLLLFRFYK